MMMTGTSSEEDEDDDCRELLQLNDVDDEDVEDGEESGTQSDHKFGGTTTGGVRRWRLHH